jgi:hypothetical protein
MEKLLRHRPTKGPVSARLYLNCRATPRLHLTENDVLGQRVLELFFFVRLCEPQVCIAWLASMSLERVDLGKMNL